MQMDLVWREWLNGPARSVGSLEIKSRPGQGTRIRVEEKAA